MAGADRWSLLKEEIAKPIREWLCRLEMMDSSGVLSSSQYAKASMRTAFSSMVMALVLKDE